MAHHFLDLIDKLKADIARMTCHVQRSVELACESVLTADQRIARLVIESDDAIDQEQLDLEKQVIDLLALHQPVAGDLRLIATSLKVASDLERIGDCAVNIAQRVPQLSAFGRFSPPVELRQLCAAVGSMLRDTVNAYNLADESVAQGLLGKDDEIDALYQQIVHDMLLRLEDQPQHAPLDLALIMIAKNLERIGDHCTNIAEDLMYVHSGRVVRHRRAV